MNKFFVTKKWHVYQMFSKLIELVKTGKSIVLIKSKC